MIPFPFQVGGLGMVSAPAAAGGGPTLVSRLDFTLMPDGDDFTDDAGHIWTAVGGAAVDDGALVTSAGSYITSPHHADFNFGTDEFCIEAIGIVDAFAERPVFAKWGAGATTGYFCGFNAAGNGIFYHMSASGGLSFPVDGPATLGVLRHFAWYKRPGGTQVYMSINGTVTALTGPTPGGFAAVTAAQTIGAVNYAAGGLGLHLHQLRVLRGPGSALPATSFTPPSSI